MILRSRELRRPIALVALSLGCLVLHSLLLRAAAHGHVAHVLLGAGNSAPAPGSAAIAISLLVVRFVAYVVVPGMLLAAAAEVIAYLLVGPKRNGH